MLSKDKKQENTPRNNKEIFLKNLKERQGEARLVRRIVAIVALAIFLFVAILGTTGYLYIKSSLKPVIRKVIKKL